jgi:ATP-dependent Clp protease ATP-binding subunit ClpC
LLRDNGKTFERFTDRARRVLTLAQEEARLLGHSFIGTEHILLGLMREGEGVAAEAIGSFGISLEAARAKICEYVGSVPVSAGVSRGSPPFTPRAKKVLELSLREALQLGDHSIDTHHILLGLLREGEGVAAQALVSLGADLGVARHRVVELMTASGPRDVRRGDRPSGAPKRPAPLCPQCRASLVDAARFRRMEVASAPDDDHEEPMSIVMVFCSRCGTTLEMFR